jgi:hypothetical protein
MGAGWVLGRSSVPEHSAQQQAQAAPPAVASADNTPAFSATFYRDQEFREVAFTRKDKSLALDWPESAPPGLEQGDHFRVRFSKN